MADTLVAAGDPRFFSRTGPHPLAAAAFGQVRPDEASSTRRLHGIAPLQPAGPAEVSFINNRRYADLLRATRIGAKARVGAQAGVMANGAAVVGSPAQPLREFFRGVATLRRLARSPRTGGDAAGQE